MIKKSAEIIYKKARKWYKNVLESSEKTMKKTIEASTGWVEISRNDADYYVYPMVKSQITLSSDSSLMMAHQPTTGLL